LNFSEILTLDRSTVGAFSAPISASTILWKVFFLHRVPKNRRFFHLFFNFNASYLRENRSASGARYFF